MHQQSRSKAVDGSRSPIVPPAPVLDKSAAWDLQKQVTALRKGGDPEGAIRLAREGLAQLPDFEPLQSALCWALYDRDIKSLGEEPALDKIRQGWQTCKELQELLSNDLYGDYSAWISAVLRIATVMLDHAGSNNTSMLRTARDMLQEMDAGKLSTQGYSGGPSPAERHAMGLTKSYHRLQEWEPLRCCCENSLRLLPSGTNGELWLRHRLGLACLELGDVRSAAPHLAFVLQRKPGEWWANYNDGRVKAATGDASGATRAFATALKGGTLHMKTQVMVDLADILRAQGNSEDADRHHLVAREIRSKQGWKSSAEIDAPLEPDQNTTPQDLPKLKQFWEELTPEERHRGRVRSVLPNGGSGFLDMDGGGSVYFTMKRDQPAPPEGSSVTCRMVDSFDKKKQQASRKAIDVQVVRS